MTPSVYDPELLNKEFIPWDTVVDPAYDASPKQDKLRVFENWSSYARDYTQKKIADAPEDTKPELMEERKKFEDYLSKKSDFLKTKHDLGYRFQKAAEKSNGDLLDVLRYPEELIAEGHDPEKVYKLRKAVTDELAPVLLRSGSYGLNFATRFGPLVSLAKEQLPGVYESALKQAEVDLWEKPGAFEGVVNSLEDAVGSVIPSLIGQAIVKGTGGLIQATSSALKSSSTLFYEQSVGAPKLPDPRGDDFNAPTVYSESPAVASFFRAGEDAGKAVSAAGDKIYGGQDSLFTNDPRYGKWQSILTGAAAQMPGQLAMFAIPVVGPSLSMASNTGMMYSENVDQYENDIKQTLFDEGKKSGSIPETTPFKSWEKNLSQKDLDEVRAKAAGVALPVALGQAFIEKQALGVMLSDASLKFLPAPAKAALMRLRYTNPRAAFAARILTNAGIKAPFEGAEESAQGIAKNLGSAILTGDFAIDKILKNTGEEFVGGLGGGVTATALTLNRVVKTEKSISWAQAILNGRNDAIQNDLEVIDGSNKPQESPETPQVSEAEKTKARERLGRLNEEELRHQQDIRIIEAPDADKDSLEFREAQRRAQNRQDAANWMIRQMGGTPKDSVSADRYEKTAVADREYQNALTKHIQDNLPDYKPPLQEFQRQVQETRTRFEQLRRDARANGFTQVAEAADAAEKLELERLAINFSNTSEAAEKLTQDFIGSVETDGPGRAKFARQQLARLYPNSQFSAWWNDDATVVEILNARENKEIDDKTNLDEWLSSPAGIKATALDSEAGSKTPTKPSGLLTTGQRRDAIFAAKQSVKKSGDPQLQEDFEKLENDLDFWHTTLADKDASEEDKAEARALLPKLEDALLELATAPVEAKGLNQTTANDQNQTANKAPIPSQEVPPTSATGQGTGTGEPFTIVRDINGEEVIQTEQDYINESRNIVKNFINGKMTSEQVLGNVESVRREIEAAPDLTPEQKTKWFSSFQNIPSVVEQFGKQDTSPDASASASALTAPETTGSPELIAGEGIISEQPTPVRMNSVPGDVLRTETGEVVFRSATDNTETVLRVKEGSIEKDPAALTFEDFESGDGVSLVSEASKQFSVLPNNERLVRPFFRSQPQQQTEGGETQNEIQQTEPVRQEQQGEPLRQEQQGGSSQEQSSGLQGQSQEVAPIVSITPQGGQTAKSSGSYPENAGSTPAPANPNSNPAPNPNPIEAAATSMSKEEFTQWAKSEGYAIGDSASTASVVWTSYQPTSPATSTPPVAESATPSSVVEPAPATPAIDTAAITTDVQANPAAHKRSQGRSKQVSREAAVAILTQLPENLTRKDAISIGSTAGMSRPGERVLKLAALRNDPAAVASILNGDMDAELGLFDRSSAEGSPEWTALSDSFDKHDELVDDLITNAPEVSRAKAQSVAKQLLKVGAITEKQAESAIRIAKDKGYDTEDAVQESLEELRSYLEMERERQLKALTPAASTATSTTPPAPTALAPDSGMVSNDTDAEPADPTPAAETTGQGTVDRFVFNLMGAFNEALPKMNESSLKVMTFRAQMQTEEGRAEIQRKLAGMAQTSIFAGIRSKGILDPVVEQEMAEKALYGTAFKRTPDSPEEITKSVQQDLLKNLAKMGDPFLTTNKDGDTVSYNAWFARGRNLVDRYIKAQNKRDKGTKNSEGEQDATDVENVASQDPEENALDPKESFKIEQLAQMRADAIREVYDRIAQRLARETGYPLEDARLALLHHLEKIRGVKIDPVSLGWKTEGDTSRVKPNILKVVRAKAPDIFGALEKDMMKALSSVLRAAEEQGLLSAPVIDLNNLTLESLIEASVYDEIVNGQSHQNAIAEAREKNSTSPLMPLLAKIDRKDVVAAVHSVLNNGKPFANARDITTLTQSDMQKVLDSGLLPARIQESLQALVDLSGDGMTILQNSKNEGWRRWSELLGEQMGNRAPVQVVFNLALDPAVTGQGLWQEGTNTVHISPFLTREKGLMESTLLHEMMHPVWDWKVSAFQRGDLSQLNKKEVAALTELQDLLSLVKAEADKKLAGITDEAALEIAKRDLLGSSDLREFLNEAINHKPFQDFLSELKDPDAKAKGSLFRRIVNAILKLIRGGDVASDSILQRSFELSLDLANYTDRELPIAERNKTQVEYFKKLEAQRGRSLTPQETASAAVDFAFKYPQPRIANTRAEATRLASQVLTAPELSGFLASQAYMGVSDQLVYDAIKANGGITIDVWTAGQPGTGTVVSPFKGTETKIPLNNFKPDDVKAFMRKFRPLLEVPGMHLGGWISDDTVYLDVSVVTDDEVTATLLAQDGNQLATFNIGTGEFPSTPELVARNSGALAQRRSDPDFQNLARSLQQAFGRTMGGIRGEGNPDVPAEGALPEIGVIETLTGEPATQDEINRIAKSDAVDGRGNALPSPPQGVGPEKDSSQMARQSIRPNAEPNPFVKEGIRGYNSKYGLSPAIEGHYAPINEQQAKDIAAAFEALPSVDDSPETREAYAQLEVEIQQQWDYAINEMGVTFEPWGQEGQPYANSREMVRDVRDNKHLFFFEGGEPHPFLDVRGADGLTGTEKLRAVHDLFGHAAEDFQFGPRGEENAWIKHGQMFSPLAQRAMTTETRGANSWVNFGPQNYNEDGSRKNILAQDRPYAEQKVALLPEEFMDWKGALSSTLASEKVLSGQEYFNNAEEVRAYVSKKFAPQFKALNSSLNYNILAYEAAYVVVGKQGRHYVEYNPITMLQNTRAEVDAVMREELIHAATGLVLMRKGIEWEDFYDDLGGSLSPQQKQKLKSVYRSARSDASVGAEYFRAGIQQLLYGRITETERKTAPMIKIISLIMDFVNYFRKGEVDPVVREVYEDSVRMIQGVDKKNARQNVLYSGPVAEKALPTAPMPMSALDVLYKDSESLPKPDKKIKNSAVATTLAEAALKYWGFQLNSGNITPEIEQILVNNGVEEFISALQASGKNAGDWYSTAIEVAMGVAGVIHPEISDVEVAKNIPAFSSAKEPDKAAQLVMRIALAVTSQNLNVNQNAGYAEEQYAIFSSTGKFDSSKIYGEKAESISGNLRLANELIAELGFEGAEDFIKKDFTVDGLQKKASVILGRSVKISGKLDDLVNGAALFGPKIGQGFLQNLMGRFFPVTIDLWMRRTWGRWTGDVVGDGVTDERMAKLLDSTREAGFQLPEALRTLRTVERKRQNGKPFRTMSSSVSDQLETDPEFRKSVEDLAFEFNSKGQAEYRLTGLPVTPKQAAAIAKYITPEWEAAQEEAYLAAVKGGKEKEAQKIQGEAERARRKFVRDQQRVKEKLDQTWKDLSAAGKKPKMPKAAWVASQHQDAGRTEVLDKKVRAFLKPEWSRNAKVIVADLNPVDIPSPQDRRVISRVVNKIREELSNRGYTATNADVQAVLWYPEKDVWAKLRGEEESNLKLSYDDEFITIAEGRGLGERAKAVAERIRANRAARTGEPNDLQSDARVDQATDGVPAAQTLASAPVPFQGNVTPGFNPSEYTAADRRQTTAFTRVLNDPEYQGIRNALGGKQYISYTVDETLSKSEEFLNLPVHNGDLKTAFFAAGNATGITAEQVVMTKALAIQRAQKAANSARASSGDTALPAHTRNSMDTLARHYQDLADEFADDLMSQASLAGQELRAFRMLADSLSPYSWVRKYKQPIVHTQKLKMDNDPVFKEMLERIKAARRDAANSTTTRMQKALAIAAKRFVKDTSVEEIDAYEKFARLLASNLSVREEVMQAATEMAVVSGIEAIRKAVAPDEKVDPAFLKQWEDKLRSIASEQLNGIIESRLQGGMVDAEASPELTEEQKESAREQKIMDAWRDFSDFPLAEMVFNLARSTILASDSPYSALVRKAQFDPAKIKRLQKAVKMSINTAEEIRKSVADRNMSVESLVLRLQETNPSLSETEVGALAEAVKAVYDDEVQRASAAALQTIVNTSKRDPRKLTDAATISKILPLVNMGAFKEEEVYNTLAENFGLPTWSQENADKIEAMANQVQALPEGSIERGETGQQMMLEILRANIKDSRGATRLQHMNQIASAIWTAGILSGPPTQIVNTVGTGLSVFLETFMDATGHFVEAKRRGVSTAQASEYYKDIARAWVFAFGKDANNTSLRSMNEVYTALTRGTSKFKSQKQEDLSTLELFKFDPRVAIPGNAMMAAITTGEWKNVLPQAGELGLGIFRTVSERAANRDAKGALKDYLATLKMVGRGMLATDAINSFSAATAKEMMIKRSLMQEEGLTDSEVNRQMKEIRKGGEESVVAAAKAQADQEAIEGSFGPAGTSEHNIGKARRVEQLIEQMTYGNSVMEQGRDFAANATFNSEAYGLIGATMMEVFGNMNRSAGVLAKPINPFPKTVSNLLNTSVNYTLYGYARAMGWNLGSLAMKKDSEYFRAAPDRGSAEFYSAHAKATAGTLALGALAMMLAQALKDREEKKEPFFEVHGPGPKDPKLRAQWAQSGHKPFTVRIGSLELRYTDWPGINIPLGMLGTVYDNLVHTNKEADVFDQLFIGVASVLGTTLDRNMLGGATALFDLMSKNTYDGAKEAALGKLAGSYTGGYLKPAYIRYLETVATGGYQDARSMRGWFLSQIPVVGALANNPAINVLGEPIKISAWDATAGRLVSLSDTHPILSPLTQADLVIAKPEAYKIYDPSKTTLVRSMSAGEEYEYAATYGKIMKERLTPELVQSLTEQAKFAPQGAQDVLTNLAVGVRNQAQGELAAKRQIEKGKELKGP